MNRFYAKPGPWIVLMAGLTLAVGLTGIGPRAFGQEKSKAELSQDSMAQIEAMSRAFRVIAEKAKPGVVSITAQGISKKVEKRREEINPEDLPEPLREFFRDGKGRRFDRRFFTPKPPAPRGGMGSGVVIDAKNGYVITNNHVVEQAAESEDSRIDVTLADGKKLTAKIVGRDPKTDLALVQIKPDGLKLHELPLGDSDKIETGDLVLAIGAPYGLTQTVTQGIVSATGRDPHIIEGYEGFIQTDAAINPGNSGGPLLNMKGEVIGINTAIVSTGLSVGNMGIGFAVPSTTVKELLPLWKEGKEIVRGYLGVQIKSLAEDFEPGMGKTYGLSQDKGILVEKVLSKTPAAMAGLKVDDVLLAYGGKEPATVRELQRWVAMTKPQTKVDLKVWRDSKEITIPVTIEKQPADFSPWGRPGRGEEGSRGGGESGETEIPTLGMTVDRVTPEVAKQYGWEDEKELEGASLIVTEVEPLGEAAAGLGIREGDLILSVQGKAVRSGDDLREALSQSALSEGVRLRIKDVQTMNTHTLFARSSK